MIQTQAEALEAQRQLRRSLDGVEISPPQAHAGLTVWFLLGGAERADYDRLDEALANGRARIRETDVGSVPELTFSNDGDRPVLLADGEELLGGLQNRSLNLSILAPARATITIPVSCMEAGRWGYTDQPSQHARHSQPRGDLGGSGHIMNARLRMQRTAAVSDSLRRAAGSRRSDQAALWAEIDEFAAALDAPSSTGALNRAFEQYGSALGEYERALQPRGSAARRACGAIFAIDGAEHGLDLFDARPTFQGLFPKLIRSWSLDAIVARRRGRTPAPAAFNPRILLDRLARLGCRVYPAVGRGADARLTQRGSRLHGAALLADGRAVHVSAFHREFAS